jgi:putative membrane protein
MSPLYWLTPWEPSFVVAAATLLAGLAFWRGGRAARPGFGRILAFWSGLALLYIVSHTQFDYYAEHEFFMHRIQHAVLHHLGPFLIALSRPFPVFAAVLPLERLKKPLAAPLRVLTRPVAAVILFDALIVLWLSPPVHFLGMIDWRLYRLMNWGMAVNGLMFWGQALNGGRWSPACRILMMLAVVPTQIALGVVIMTAPHELYPVYGICGRAFGGLSPLTDQRIGGAVLWMCAAMTSVAGILIVLWRDVVASGRTAFSRPVLGRAAGR